MLKRRWVIAVIAIAVAIVAVVVVLVVGASGGPARKTSPPATLAPPPAGWYRGSIGGLKLAVPNGWQPTTVDQTGVTVGVWWPGPPPPNTLPSRCVVQERPQWLLTYLQGTQDWNGALQRDLASLEAITAQSTPVVNVTDVHSVDVPGAAAALAFSSTISEKAGGPALQSVDVLIALSNGTEIHDYCSGPGGTLPPNLLAGVTNVSFAAPPR